MAIRYTHIADDLRSQITDGELTPGTRLPPETTLATHYGVGLPTLRRALGVLQEEGLIEKRHGRGNFVCAPRERVRYGADAEAARAVGERIAAVKTTRQQVTAAGRVSQLLGVEPGTPLVEYHSLAHREDGTPCAVIRVYIRPEVLGGEEEEWPEALRSPWGDDLSDLLYAAGVDLARRLERIVTRPARSEEVDELAVTVGTWVLDIERTTQDNRGCVVQAAFLVLPGHRGEAVYSVPMAA